MGWSHFHGLTSNLMKSGWSEGRSSLKPSNSGYENDVSRLVFMCVTARFLPIYPMGDLGGAHNKYRPTLVPWCNWLDISTFIL